MKITIILFMNARRTASYIAMCNFEYNYIRPCQVTQKELMTRELMTKILYTCTNHGLSSIYMYLSI